MKHAILGLAALLTLAGAPLAHAQEQIDLPAETYVQAASGMTFPVEIGHFVRLGAATRYNPDGTDESVGYDWETKAGRVSATIYVYPSPALANANAAHGNIDQARRDLCEAQFSAVRQQITTVSPTAVLTEDDATTLRQRGGAHSGRKLAFTISPPSAFGKDHAPLRSEAYLFCYVGGRWNVKYRFTYPAAIRAERAIADFMRDLVWTIEPEVL